jgi:mannose-6-phosphate isomerase
MFKLNCASQNYAWGKFGSESLVGQIYARENPTENIKQKPFAEFWMGDHPNGPSKVFIDKANAELAKIIDDDSFMEKYD